MHNVWFVVSACMVISCLASLISIRLGVSVARIEILLGVVAGNVFGIKTHDRINFLATSGGIADLLGPPKSLRSHLNESLSVGVIALLAPRRCACSVLSQRTAYHQALITGIAFSTTS